MAAIWQHWLLYAWIVPLAWGLSVVVDVLMIEWKIYQNPEQACALSGIVVAIPLILLFIPTADFQSVDAPTVSVGIGSGLCYALHLLFFYKALFTANDAAHAETFMNTEVVFVPLLAYLILGEQLSDPNYLSIFLAGAGVLILNWGARRIVGHRRLTLFLAFAVLGSSMGFIIQDILFDLSDYSNALVLYALGLLLGIAPIMLSQGVKAIGQRLKRYLKPILCAELFTLIATAASTRAIDIGPSVSLVAVIESVRPVLIMLVCFMVWSVTRRSLSVQSGTVVALRKQFSASGIKVLACTLITGGVFFASLN